MTASSKTSHLHETSTAIGTVYVPDGVPAGYALYYTGSEFRGHLNADAVEAIRSVTRQLSGIDAPLSTCHQVHGTAIARFSREDSGWCEQAGCDALWSDTNRSALGIKVADCLPVTMIDAQHSVTVNIHAGWRGASADIVGVAVAAVRDATRFDLTSSEIFLGPSIRSCCFEVGEEVVDAFAKSFGFAHEHVIRRSGAKPHVDLPAMVASELRSLGATAERIHDSGVCTRCDERFHSYRRGRAEAGRNLAIVAQ